MVNFEIYHTDTRHELNNRRECDIQVLRCLICFLFTLKQSDNTKKFKLILHKSLYENSFNFQLHILKFWVITQQREHTERDMSDHANVTMSHTYKTTTRIIRTSTVLCVSTVIRHTTSHVLHIEVLPGRNTPYSTGTITNDLQYITVSSNLATYALRYVRSHGVHFLTTCDNAH